jgi:hypothetical protein
MLLLLLHTMVLCCGVVSLAVLLVLWQKSDFLVSVEALEKALWS